ncbi:unnamed protein product, partial [Porites evermanni]
MTQSGSGKLIKRDDLNFVLKFKDFTFAKFRHMCILSGCDYASSMTGIGLQCAITVLEAADIKAHNGPQLTYEKSSTSLPLSSLKDIVTCSRRQTKPSSINQCSTLIPKEWFQLM